MRFAILILLTLLFSCSSDNEKINESFVKKYHEEIKRINEQRAPAQKEAKSETIISQPPTKEEVIEELASKAEYYPYADISLIGDAPRDAVLPNRETYELSKNQSPSNSLPPNIFEISYNLGLYPPFHKIGAEFDAINVPQADAFGVSTELKNKEYLLVGNNSLQRSIDSINSEKTKDNIDITRMLVTEKKKILRNNTHPQILNEEASAKKIDPKQQTLVKTESAAPKSIAQQVSGFIREVASTPNTSPQK